MRIREDEYWKEQQECSEIISANILHFLNERGMKKSELARAIGVSPSNVGDWCNQKKIPPIYRLKQIARVLNIGVDDLVVADSLEKSSETGVLWGTKRIYDAVFNDREYRMPGNAEYLLERAMKQLLTPREALVLQLRYGWHTEPETLAQISDTLNITKERVRQIQETALRNLRNHGDELLGLITNIQTSPDFDWTKEINLFDDIELMISTRHCIYHTGITTLYQLLGMTEGQIIHIPEIKPVNIAELCGLRRLVWTHPYAGKDCLKLWDRNYWKVNSTHQ